MKKINFKSIMTMVFGAALSLALVVQAHAMTPTVSLTNNGYGTIQATVYGDANSSVILDYYSGGQLLGAGVIGYTNYSGQFSAQLNPSNYIIPNGAQVVIVVNGQQSAPVTWTGSSYNNGGTGCYYSSYPYYCTGNIPSGQITLSQSSVSLTTGQTQTVYINNGNVYNNGYYNTNQYYISNISNGVVSASISGNTISLYGQSQGSTTLSICSGVNNGSNYYGSGCASLYVTVTGYNGGNTCYYPYSCGTPTCVYPYYNCNNGGYYNSPITVSNSNVQVTVGSTGTVALYGGSNNSYPYTTGGYYGTGTYYVSNNYSNVATATVNGSTLSIYGTTPGSTTITVCSSGGASGCATVNVTVIAPTYSYGYPYNVYNGQYANQPGYYYSNTQHCWLHY